MNFFYSLINIIKDERGEADPEELLAMFKLIFIIIPFLAIGYLVLDNMIPDDSALAQVREERVQQDRLKRALRERDGILNRMTSDTWEVILGTGEEATPMLMRTGNQVITTGALFQGEEQLTYEFVWPDDSTRLQEIIFYYGEEIAGVIDVTRVTHHRRQWVYEPAKARLILEGTLRGYSDETNIVMRMIW